MNDDTSAAAATHSEAPTSSVRVHTPAVLVPPSFDMTDEIHGQSFMEGRSTRWCVHACWRASLQGLILQTWLHRCTAECTCVQLGSKGMRMLLALSDVPSRVSKALLGKSVWASLWMQQL